MNERKSRSNGHDINYACIRFRNQKAGEYNIVAIDCVEERINKKLTKFEPNHDNDFVKNKFYYVLMQECSTDRRSGTEACNEDAGPNLYHKAHVLHLGESDIAVKNKIVNKRVRFPNKKYCNNSSTTEIEGTSSSLQHSKINQKKLKERSQKRRTDKADEELQRFYGKRQVDNREQVVDSDSDGDEPVRTESDSMRQEQTEGRIEVSQKQGTTANQRTNTNDGISLENRDHEQEETNNLQGEGHDEQLQRTQGAAGDESQAHRNIRSSSFQRTSDRENIVARHLEHLTNVVTPERVKKREAMRERIPLECHGLRRFDIVNGKMYLGLDVFIGKESWLNIMAQKPTTFIRDTGIIIWGEATLINRCFDKTKVSVSFIDRSPRKEFEVDKLQLLRELLEHYLDEHRYCEKDKTRHKRNLNTILARFVQDARKPYKHLVRKQLLY